MANLTDIERLNYYEGEYLGALDFEAEQDYHRDMRRRHNLGPHTPGIFAGLDLAQTPNGGANNQVDIALLPGVAVDGFGREMVVLNAAPLTQQPFEPYYDPNPAALPRYMAIWISYAQAMLQTAQNSIANRVQESYQITVTLDGQSPTNDALTVDGNSVNPPPMPTATPAAVPGQIVLPYDGSVPYQEFATDDNLVTWYVCLGRVKWDPHNGVFLQVDPVFAANGRQYAGNVSAAMYVPGGNLVVQSRSAPYPLPSDPKDPNYGGVMAEIAGALQVDRMLNPLGSVLVGTMFNPNSKTPLSPLSIAGSDPNGELIQFQDSSGNETWHICQNLNGNTPGINFGEIVKGNPVDGRLFLQAGGNVGLGTTLPQQNLSVNGGMNIDLANQNQGQIAPGANPALTFGSASGEGIGSNRAGAANQWGLDFYTAFTVRMSLSNQGMLGIGTTAPQSQLHISGGQGNVFATEGDLKIGSPTIRLKAGVTLTGANAGDVRICASGGSNRLLLASGPLDVLTVQNNNVGINNSSPVFNLDILGNVRVDGWLWVTGAKFGYVADRFVYQSDQALERGDVVVLNAEPSGNTYGAPARVPIIEIELTGRANDARVCGIVDEPVLDPAQYADLDAAQVGALKVGLMVTLGAYAFCKVDAIAAAIKPGDLLTTSANRGYAQKCGDGPTAGTVIAKAMAALPAGRGVIPVFVTHQ